MKFTIITPSYNSETFLEETIKSVIHQRKDGIDLEYIIIDGGSRDNTHTILSKYKDDINHLVIEQDKGPANAINKGLTIATGEIIGWLNADDSYSPHTLRRILVCFQERPDAALCFGHCTIVDNKSQVIRQRITRFKEFFFPISSRFTHQCINYISQPAMFFRHSAMENAGILREDMIAAWDYEFVLRLWQQGENIYIPGRPLASFRWHEKSISGQNFLTQFKEEFEAVRDTIGWFKLQTLIHFFVRWAIVGIYTAMSIQRNNKNSKLRL